MMTSEADRVPLRIGIAGSARHYAPYSQATASASTLKTVAIADEEPASARAWMRRMGRCRTYSDPDLLLADPDIEAVLCLSEPACTPDYVLAALKRGKHAFVEAPTNPDARWEQTAELAREHSLILMPSMPLRYEPGLRAAAACIAAGRIGALQEIRCEWTFHPSWVTHLTGSKAWWPVLARHAIQTLSLAADLLGSPFAVSADIDPPQGGSGASDLATIIVQHLHGVSIHHIARATGSPRLEQYILTGRNGVIDAYGPAKGVIDRSIRLTVMLRTPEGDEALVRSSHQTSHRTNVDDPPPYQRMLEEFGRACHSGSGATTLDHWFSGVRAFRSAAVAAKDRVKLQIPLSTMALIGGQSPFAAGPDRGVA